jgi:molybdenum cofactor cytidylyltransferase
MIGGILLAAGTSRRFGGDKLSFPLPDGTLIAVASAATLVAALPRVVAVVRPGARAHAALRACGAQVVVCPRADEGMGTSLAWGVAATAGWTGWVVALADMPFVKPVTVSALVAAVTHGAALAAPRYQGRRGHPVCFGASYREALLELRGDRGGRDLLRSAGNRIRLLDCDDPGVLADIDTPAAMERLVSPPGTVAAPPVTNGVQRTVPWSVE